MSNSSAALMPWIGLYAAAATLLWIVLLIADIVHSIRYWKPWFPCKYSALNAASLTVISVAVKFAMDISTDMYYAIDELAKLSSSFLLQASMVHMMPSLGTMNDREKLVNLAALGILVLTLSVNILIQMFTQNIALFLMQAILLLLNIYSFFVLSSSALMVSSNNRHLENNYNKLQARISSEGNDYVFDFDKLKSDLNKYWVMAKTGSPQFVIARSEACYVLSLIANNYFILVTTGFVYAVHEAPKIWATSTEYKWSLKVIYVTQLLAVYLCLLISFVRFLHAFLLNIRHFSKFLLSILCFDLQNYGIEQLIEWKKKPPPLQIRGQNRRIFIHLMRNLLLNIGIGCQVVIVITNKVLVLITFALTPGVILWYAMTTLLIVPVLLPLLVLMRRRKKTGESEEASVDPNYTSEHNDLRNFVLLLEGETIQDKYLKFIYNSINASIMMGAKHNPRHLIKLLEKSTSFRGILDFQSDQVSPTLIHKEPPNSWTLPIVILTSIMIGLPNIENHKKKQFIQSVIEGFKYVQLVEKSMDAEKRLASSQNAAYFVWAGVELQHKWLDIDLKELACQSKSYLETLQTLAQRSEEILKEFTSGYNLNEDMIESPKNYPRRLVAANSMYKISHTLMLNCAETTTPSHSDTHMFDKLSVMVADIFIACLTTLPHVILTKCKNGTIEQREQSVEKAVSLLGETRGILRVLQKREIPIILHVDRLVYIDEWHAYLLRHTNYDNGTGSSGSGENITSGDSMETSAVEDSQLHPHISIDELTITSGNFESNEEMRAMPMGSEDGEDYSEDNQREDGQV